MSGISQDSEFQSTLVGNITAVSQTIDITTSNQTTERVQLSGTWVGTLIIEGSNDSITYYAVTTTKLSNGIPVSNITTNDIYTADTNAYKTIRIRSSAWTSGTATVTVWGSDHPNINDTSHFIKGSDGTIIGNSGDSLKVTGNIAAGATDKSSFTYGTSIEQTIGGVYQDSSPSLTSGQTGAIRSTANRALHTNLRDSNGNEVGTILSADGSRHLNVNTIQEISIIAGSSSTANLASGASFTGASSSNLGVAAVQVNFKADQTCIIQLQQSPDNTNWDYVDTYTVPANKGDSRVFQAMGSYVRTVVTNSGTSATTFLRLQTALAPIMETMPRSLGQKLSQDSVPVVLASDNAIQFESGTKDIFGALVTANRNNQIEVDFSSGIVNSTVNTSYSNSGAAVIANGYATFSTGTATSATAKGVSFTKINYVPAHEIYVDFTTAFTIPTSANSFQRIGLYDSSNGVFIGYNGTTFVVGYRSGGIDTIVPKSSWDDPLIGGSTSLFTRSGIPEAIDFSKFNIWRIRFGWLGGAPIVFEVVTPDGKWIAFHTIKYPNTNVAPHIQSPNLPVTIEVSKTSADATNLLVRTSCWVAGTSSEAQLSISPDGLLRTVSHGANIFTDDFESTDLDFQNNWLLPIISSSGSYSLTNSNLNLNTSTVASRGILLQSISTFERPGSAPFNFQFLVKLETAIVTNNYRFWGIGTYTGSLTSTTTPYDAIGFEITTSGIFRSVVYGGGSLLYSQTLTPPTDGNIHQYEITSSSAYTYWMVDSKKYAQASCINTNPYSSNLPISLISVNGSTPPSSSPTLTLMAVNINDQSGSGMNTNATVLSDVYSSYIPNPASYDGSQAPIATDAGGALITRSTVLTDEGSFRDDFSGSIFTTLTGTVQLVNGLTAVVGTGTLFTSEVLAGSYIKKVSDTEVYYARVSYIVNDTLLYLDSGYTGTTSTGNAYGTADWQTYTASGGGGSIALNNSVLTLTSGTISGNSSTILRSGDYLPYNLLFKASISQRIANQSTILGFVDNKDSISKAAYFLFDGTDNTKVKCYSAFSSLTGDSEIITVTLPNNGTTSSYHLYEVDLTASDVVFLIDSKVVAKNTNHLPGPYDVMNFVMQMSNSATVTTTNLLVDWVYFADLDRLQIANDFNGDPIPSRMMGIDITTGLPKDLSLDIYGNLIVSPLGGVGAAFSFGQINVSSTTPTPMESTAYTEQSTNAQRSIASANVNDTAAGTGAQQVTITYFDQTGAGPYTEVVTLNGTTGVNTVATNICFIEKMQVTRVGSSGSNTGVITLYTTTNKGGSTIGTIGATLNQTFWCHHYVTIGKICRIAGVSGAIDLTSSSYTLIYLKSKPINSTGAVDLQISDSIKLYGGTSDVQRNYSSPITVSGPARVTMWVAAGSNSNQNVFGSFDYSES